MTHSEKNPPRPNSDRADELRRSYGDEGEIVMTLKSNNAVTAAVANGSPINIRTKLLAPNSAADKLLNPRAILSGNGTVFNPLLNFLVPASIKSTSGLHGATKKLNRLRDRSFCIHDCHSRQEKLATQAVKQQKLAMTGGSFFPIVRPMKETLHQHIKRLRLEAGLSMEELATKCDIKSWQAVQQWEKAGGTAPKRTRLKLAAKALRVTEEYLLFGDGAQAESDPPSLDLQADPEEQAEQIIEAVRTILRIAKLPEDCLGAPDSLRAALASKEPLERYSLTEIEETLHGLHQDKPAAFRNAHPDELFSALAGKLRSKGQDYAETEKQPPDPMQAPINR